MADDAPFLPGLSPVAGKPVQVTFDAGRLTSDGGVLLLSEIERRLGIAERLGRCIEDPRAPERIEHGLAEMIRFRALLIAAGYQDGNDCDALRADPVLASSSAWGEAFPLVIGEAMACGMADRVAMGMWRLRRAERAELGVLASRLPDVEIPSIAIVQSDLMLAGYRLVMGGVRAVLHLLARQTHDDLAAPLGLHWADQAEPRVAGARPVARPLATRAEIRGAPRGARGATRELARPAPRRAASAGTRAAARPAARRGAAAGPSWALLLDPLRAIDLCSAR